MRRTTVRLACALAAAAAALVVAPAVGAAPVLQPDDRVAETSAAPSLGKSSTGPLGRKLG